MTEVYLRESRIFGDLSRDLISTVLLLVSTAQSTLNVLTSILIFLLFGSSSSSTGTSI